MRKKLISGFFATIKAIVISRFFIDCLLSFSRQMKLNNELNNMSWRVRPDEVLLEVGRLFGSRMGLQKLNFEVN